MTLYRKGRFSRIDIEANCIQRPWHWYFYLCDWLYLYSELHTVSHKNDEQRRFLQPTISC